MHPDTVVLIYNSSDHHITQDDSREDINLFFVWGFLVAVRVGNNSRAQMHQHAIGYEPGLDSVLTKEGYRM